MPLAVKVTVQMDDKDGSMNVSLLSPVQSPKALRRSFGVIATNAVALVVALLLCSTYAQAAVGDCSQPVSSGDNPTASDCLFVLRVAVGTQSCGPACVCDPNGSDDTTASDALVCLKKAVGQNVRLNCRCPVSPAGDEIAVNAYTTGAQLRPAVAADAQGGFVVAWESSGSIGNDADSYSIQAQRFSNTGQRVGTEFQVNEATEGNQEFTDVAAGADGSFVVTWDDGGANVGDVRARRFDAAGDAVGTEFVVNTYTTENQGISSVAVDQTSGGFVVVWQSYGSTGTDTSKFSIHGQRYDDTGAAAGTEFQVNTLTPESQITPEVAIRSGGGFVVVWTSLAGSGTDPDVNVRGQMFGPDGAKESSEFRINSYTTGVQSSVAVAPDGANGFVVVWQSNGSATDSDFAIVARLAGPSGTFGSEFFVNSYTTGAQTDPRIVRLDETRFVIVWNSYETADDTGYSVRGQAFGNDGFPIGTEFRVNAYTTAAQSLPDVASDGSGNFMVVWDSEGSSGADSDGTSILGQRFE